MVEKVLPIDTPAPPLNGQHYADLIYTSGYPGADYPFTARAEGCREAIPLCATRFFLLRAGAGLRLETDDTAAADDYRAQWRYVGDEGARPGQW